jgi:hypothetical protein
MAEASPFLPIYAVLGAVILIAAAMLWYVWSLRNRLDTAIARLPPDCAAYSALLTGYNDLPLGVPRGTVRAVLAVILVFGSVVFLAVSMLGTESGVVYKFPEALTGILGAILGFYFGKGSSGEDSQAVSAVAAASADARAAVGTAADARAQADAARRQAADAQQSLGAVQAQHDALAGHQLDHIRTGLQAGADIGRVVASSLPGSFGTEVGAAADALAQTAATVADLSTGDLGGAVQKATQLAQQAASNMPVVQVLAKAAPMIASALGGAIPPVALIAALVSGGSLLSAAAYNRWIARVMDAPYTPEQFSPTVFDSNAARSLIAGVPVLMRVFGQKIASDTALALKIVRLALSEDGDTALLDACKDDFAGLDQPTIAQAVRDLQKAALDTVLVRDLPAGAGNAVGGAPAMLHALDLIRADRGASAGLDAVYATVQAVRTAGRNPATEFAKAAAVLAPSGATP